MQKGNQEKERQGWETKRTVALSLALSFSLFLLTERDGISLEMGVGSTKCEYRKYVFLLLPPPFSSPH